MTGRRSVFVGIAGGSGSGKTWLAQRIAAAFTGEAALVSLDDFYQDRSHLTSAARCRVNYDHPRAINWSALREFLDSYRRGIPSALPRYNFATHCQERPTSAGVWKPVLVVEGLWTFARRELRPIFDVRIFVECPEELRLARRVARDTTERGRSERDVEGQFRRTVAPMHNIHVAPQKELATTALTHPISEADVEQVIRKIEGGIKKGAASSGNAIVSSVARREEWRAVA
jgi:uridine kinase